MAYSQLLEKHGSPLERSMQGAAKRQSLNRLLELERTRSSRADADAAMGPGRLAITGERDYFDRLNDEGEMSRIQSSLSGRRPSLQHSYGGTSFAEEGESPMSSQRPSMRALETDNSDYYARQAGLRRANADADRAETLAFDADTADDPVFVRRRGDLARDEFVRNARAEGEGESARFLAPGQSDVRRQKMWDAEDAQQRLGPYSPAAVRAENELAKQRLINEREALKAFAGYNGRIDAQRIRSFGAVGASEANQGADVSHYRDTLDPSTPTDKSISEDEIAGIARDRGLDPQAVRQYFADRGYRVANVPVR